MVIPSEIDGLPVELIAENGGTQEAGLSGGAFEGSDIESVYIPDTVVNLGHKSFLNCKKLKKLHLVKSRCCVQMIPDIFPKVLGNI